MKEKDISFLIPYQHSEERYELLKACLKTLPNPDLVDENIEICIMECGKESKLEKLSLPIRTVYGFVEHIGIFNRGWLINVGVRNLTTGRYLVILDGDLICSSTWYDEILEKKEDHKKRVYMGWKTMVYLTPHSTRHYLSSGVIKPNFNKIIAPSIHSAAGGVTCLRRDSFIGMKGIPEYFFGSWGGEDNSFMMKMMKFDYKVKPFTRSKLYHMFHKKTTKRDQNKLNKIHSIKTWTGKKWKEELDKIGDNWGRIHEYK